MKCFSIFRKIKRNKEIFIKILEKFRKFKEYLKKIQEDMIERLLNVNIYQ